MSHFTWIFPGWTRSDPVGSSSVPLLRTWRMRDCMKTCVYAPWWTASSCWPAPGGGRWSPRRRSWGRWGQSLTRWSWRARTRTAPPPPPLHPLLAQPEHWTSQVTTLTPRHRVCLSVSVSQVSQLPKLFNCKMSTLSLESIATFDILTTCGTGQLEFLNFDIDTVTNTNLQCKNSKLCIMVP